MPRKQAAFVATLDSNRNSLQKGGSAHIAPLVKTLESDWSLWRNPQRLDNVVPAFKYKLQTHHNYKVLSETAPTSHDSS